MADAGAVEISILVEVDRSLIAEQLRAAGEEFGLAELCQTPNHHFGDLFKAPLVEQLPQRFLERQSCY